jgi:hypothetical protein
LESATLRGAKAEADKITTTAKAKAVTTVLPMWIIPGSSLQICLADLKSTQPAHRTRNTERSIEQTGPHRVLEKAPAFAEAGAM